MFDVKVFNNKISEAKPLHLTNDLQLTSQTVRFYLPTHFIFDEKFVSDSDSKFLPNFLHSFMVNL